MMLEFADTVIIKFADTVIIKSVQNWLLACLLACSLGCLLGLFVKYFFCLLIGIHSSSKYIPFIYVNLEDLNYEIFNIGCSTK